MLQLPYPVILASASPRRKELLGRILADFTVIPSEVDEEADIHEDPENTALRLATLKALAVGIKHPNALIIGADTVVAIAEDSGWLQLAKPLDRSDAVRMLTLLSGKAHSVFTGVCLHLREPKDARVSQTKVVFRDLTPSEIEDYVETGEPMDKAGAYAIQGGAAGFVTEVNGSISNVIGLPMEDLEPMLSGFPRFGSG